MSSQFLGFNSVPPTVMHIDLNSCFATIEQQANPRFRGKPVAVVAYVAPNGCILAASYEAKQFGVTTGMRVNEGQKRCPNLIILPSDPPKYRYVNQKLTTLLSSYTDEFTVMSIDELVLQLRGKPALLRYVDNGYSVSLAMRSIGMELKNRIKQEIGEWLTVSIGIGPNRFLAKTASNLQKPDGLSEITKENVNDIFSNLSVTDLCGIKHGFGERLKNHGITTAYQMYSSSAKQLHTAFSSILGQYWWLWLHGYETADTKENQQKTIGHSLALYTPFRPSQPELLSILRQLSDKTGRRLRNFGFQAYGTSIGCQYADYSYWHKAVKSIESLWKDTNIYASALKVLRFAPDKPIRTIAISLFAIQKGLYTQLSFDEQKNKDNTVTKAVDIINARFGEGSIVPATILHVPQKVLDRISFGNVKI